MHQAISLITYKRSARHCDNVLTVAFLFLCSYNPLMMINGYGPVYGNIGYTIHTINFFQALNSYIPVCLVPVYPNIHSCPVPQSIQTMIDRQKDIDISRPAICIHAGNELHKFTGSHKIGFPVFDHTRLPAQWINLIRQMDDVWTPSTWGRTVLIDNGIDERSITIIPEGFDPTVFRPCLEEKKKDVFTFLSIGKWEERKGQRELLMVWEKFFGNRTDVELIALWHNPFISQFSIKDEIKKLGLHKTANIKIVDALPTNTLVAQLYHLADCFVLPTRAEGWGLPILEAMASGLPVITTRYSAITDYAHDEIAYLMDVTDFIPATTYLYDTRPGERGMWPAIDTTLLHDTMLHVLNNRDEARIKGLRASKEVHTKWTWNHAAQKAVGVLQKRGLIECHLQSNMANS